jgi:flagellar basal body rod protein FlgB
VRLEDQMMKISETASDFALTTSLYRQQINLLKMALGSGSSSS